MLTLLFDGLNLIRRVYAGVPERADDADAHSADVERSVRASVVRALEMHDPTHAMLVMDAPGQSWRHREFPGYKADRGPMPAPLADALPALETAIADIGVRAVRVDDYEADDVIASIAVRLASRRSPVVVLTTDKSMLALLPDGVRIHHHFEGRDLDAGYVHDRFGVTPEQLPAFLALAGDATQSVPGVRGIGKKTAARLLGEHGSLDALVEALPSIEGRHANALRAQLEDVRLFERISRLRTDVEVGVNLQRFRLG